jgi:hypothetical protein
MVMLRSTSKAERAISEMPFGIWINVKSIAKRAGLGVQTMSRFLIRAKKAGIVDNKRVVVHSFKMSLWRRIV